MDLLVLNANIPVKLVIQQLTVLVVDLMSIIGKMLLLIVDVNQEDMTMINYVSLVSYLA